MPEPTCPDCTPRSGRWVADVAVDAGSFAPDEDEVTIPPAAATEGFGRRTIGTYWVTPVSLGAVLVALYLWVGARGLDSIEARRVNTEIIISRMLQHVSLTAMSTVLVIGIAVPLGIVLTRPALRRVTPAVIGVANVGTAVPSIGLLVLLALVWSFGFWPAIVALVAYSTLPVLRNTMVGLEGVDRALIEAARGMGMSRSRVLRRVELPLAVPVILAGIRTALIINVGTATLATFVAGGGLGDIINAGLVQNRPTVTVVGSVLTATLALFTDYLGGIAEDALRPRGL
jgi:osmoprotectant transport system permease protein